MMMSILPFDVDGDSDRLRVTSRSSGLLEQTETRQWSAPPPAHGGNVDEIEAPLGFDFLQISSVLFNRSSSRRCFSSQ
jgi:hypothetical protein